MSEQNQDKTLKQIADEHIKHLEKVAYDVPLCADHAQAWFTDRYFQSGDCWFCQLNDENAELRKVAKKALAIVGAATAAASNESRPLREKVYNELAALLDKHN
jgi:hypothetical protein